MDKSIINWRVFVANARKNFVSRNLSDYREPKTTQIIIAASLLGRLVNYARVTEHLLRAALPPLLAFIRTT